MSSKVKRYRILALSCHLLLIAWMSIWYLLLGTTEQYSLVFKILIYIAPLLLPLPGMLSAKPYTHAWACFIILLYVLHGITVIYAEPQFIWHAAFELVLATGMFVGCSVFARLRGQELGTGLKKLSVVMKEEKERFETKDI
ncbi:DUF2069 domain-containing protein [Agaribacter flavus]|uniref:DUF2069 domain-containing protein n=1 Tax=Agaribacter flavus TaxID=1902781 RepID=A0ABV7FQ29_9ALTE